jgi:pyruvate/2-oxoglutarate dehydrogenase complex dihydrolipoamide dehydrogenase (E3) component
LPQETAIMSARHPAPDAIVIGAGQAGPSLAVRCARAGWNTVLIERGPLGGTCVNNGCVPTKTWVASARAAQIARRGADYGVLLDAPVRVDMRAVRERKDRVIAASHQSLESWLGNTPNLRLVRGNARFTAPRTLAVTTDGTDGGDELTLTAPRIFLNVGGSPLRPAMPGLADVDALDNRSVLELDTLPEHLVIVGGSYIGLEFAQIFRRFGARVTVCEMGPRLIGREDDEVSAEVQRVLEREGVVVRTNAKCLSLARDGASGVRVHTACETGEPDVVGSHLLLAVGRTPNTADLGLAAAGIETDARGYIRVDDELRSTSADGVWALGDCNGRGAFTHTSYNDYEIVAANLFDGARRRVGDRIPVYALFTDPPLARIGASEADVRASGKPALVACLPMTRVGRAREAGETQGFMKALVDADSKRLLGATMIGLNADEVIHSLLDVMAAKLPYTAIQRTVRIHPTVSELVPTLLEGLKPLR